jgi:PAS domain S-box-containing protein
MPITRGGPLRTRYQLEAALAAADLGMWEWEVPAGVITWTPTLEQIYGLAPGSFDGSFETYLELIHPDDRAEHLATVEQAGKEGSEFDYEYRIVRPDGSVRWLRGSGRALVDDSGTLVGITGVCSDITREVERAEIAETLRQSLLPPSLPRIPGVEVEVLYLPGQFELSGDFYDVFPLTEGWGALIGDVCGKGAAAAALTSLARHTVRAAAMTCEQPAEVLEVLNQALLDDGEDRFCTATHLRLVPADGAVQVRLVSGGHPPALLRRASGEVEEVRAPGRLVGVFDRVEAVETDVVLDPGDLLVLHTDGITESRVQGRIFGDGRLRQALASPAASTPAGAVAAVEDALAAFAPDGLDDDVALLAIQPTPPS